MKIKKITCLAALMAMAAALTACTPKEGSRRIKTENEQAAAETETDREESVSEDEKRQYLVMFNDEKKHLIRLYSYEDAQQYQFYYSDSTSFLNKYGDMTTADKFNSGQVVILGGQDDQGELLKVQASDLVWEYPNVVRYSIDRDKKVFTIADTKYNWQSNLKVFDGDEEIGLGDIKEGDKLNVTGYDKQILSVVVEEGKGTISLKNTELFEGSMVQVGSHFVKEITKNMTFEIQEGSYTLAVANKGWGGQKKIRVERGKTLEVDLDELKGKGPKTGKVAFEVNADNARIYVDDKRVDDAEVVTLTYGNHAIKVMAEGYDTWEKTLCVNSKESTVRIDLDGSGSGDSEKEESTSDKEKTTAKSSSKTKTDQTQKKQGIGSGIGTGIGSGIDSVSEPASMSDTNSTGTSSSSGSSSSGTDAANLKDYVSTLSGLLNTIK